MKAVTILLPTLNEEAGITHVLDEIPVDDIRAGGFEPEVLVVDGHSKDRTVLFASQCGARVITQEGRGKGWAVRTGFEESQTEYLVMLDADCTYPAAMIPEFLQGLEEGTDIVFGSRLRGTLEPGAMRPLNVLGNRALSFFASALYGRRISDVCSGMLALGPRAKKAIVLNSSGFEVEAEIFAQAVKQGLRVREIPIPYRCRKGEPKLGSISDGLKIAAKLLRKRFVR